MPDPGTDSTPAVPAGQLDPARVAALPKERRALLDRLLANRSRAQRTAAHVQQLRSGTGDPLVLIHPVGGDLFCYGDLVRRLPPGAPIVALSPDELLSGPQPPTMAQLARHYLARISDAGLRPAVLAGWSFGGVLAYEMARQLAEIGQPAEIVMIDSMPRPAEHAAVELTDADLIEYFWHDLIRSTGHESALSADPRLYQLPPAVALRSLEQELTRQGIAIEDLSTRYQTYVNASHALQHYDPPGYSGPVHLLRAADWDGPHQAEIWRRHLTGPFWVQDLPANHYAVLREPALAQVVSLIREALHGRTPANPSMSKEEESDSSLPDRAAMLRIRGDLDEPTLVRALTEAGWAEAELVAAGAGEWQLTLGARDDLCNDLARHYAAACETDEPALHHAAACETVVSPEQLDYWRERLSGSRPGSWPHDAPATQEGSDHVELHVGGEQRRMIDRLATEHWVHPIVVIATTLQILLARVGPKAGCADDVTIAATLRTTGDPQTLVLRQAIDPDESYTNLIRRAAAQIVTDRRHGAVPTADLETMLGKENLFEVSLILDEEGPRRVRLGAAVAELIDPPPDLQGGRLAIVLHPEGAGLAGRLYFDTASYALTSASRIAASLTTLLSDAVLRPGTLVGDLHIVAAQPQVAASYVDSPIVPKAFAAAAARFPDAVALKWPGGQLTYLQLNEAARKVAAGLAGAKLVALYGGRSPQLAIALLAIVLSGAAYVPLDPSYPPQRLRYMVSDSTAEVVICCSPLPAEVAVPPGCRVLTVAELLTDRPIRPGPDDSVAADGLAYVMYTSGSTGVPKGVAMSHQPLANLISWQLRRSTATVGWNTLQFAPISFDASFQEIFATWCGGGTLVLVDDELRRDPRQLLRYLDEQQIHRIFLPFVALRMLAESAVAAAGYPQHLREVITAGEQLRITTEIRLFFAQTGASLDNQYGPTETHVVTAERLPAEPHGWPALPSIGHPIDGAAVHVLDARLRPLPMGITGEICVGGPVLADGYLGRPDLTEQRFCPGPEGSGRLYRTGDLGRVGDDGRLDFLGRNDIQVKVRGFRIEPAEVEAGLCAVNGVADAVVIADETPDGFGLTGYCVPVPGAPLSAEYLRSSLAETLPDHMVPARLVVLERFPLTPSGKVDRSGLSRPAQPAPSPCEPMSPAEEQIAQIYRELLAVTVPGPTTSFFELGGNSLSLARLATRLEELFGPTVPLAELFTHNTVAAQALLMDRLFAAELEEYSDAEAAAVLAQILVE